MDFRDHGIDLRPGATGNTKTRCPKCSEGHGRHDKPLSVHVERGLWNCHRCRWTGSLNGPYRGFPYDYLGADGQIYTKWRRPAPNHKCDWGSGRNGVDVLPYGIIRPGDRLWHCEGESDCDAVQSLGLAAITMDSTTKDPPVKSIAPALEHCILWDRGDSDRTGERRRDRLAKYFDQVKLPYRIIDLPEGIKDVALFVEAGHTAEDLTQLAEAAALRWQGDVLPAVTTMAPANMRQFDLSPRCIIKDFLYSDVREIASPGGSGKSTLMLLECISIALGRPFLGLEVMTQGPVLYVTAEDPESILRRRFVEIMDALGLTEEQQDLAASRFHVVDARTRPLYLADKQEYGVLRVSPLVNQLIHQYAPYKPISVYLDPRVNFTLGEENCNEDAQVLLTAVRKLSVGLNAAVSVIHHTGKSVLREGITDMYSGRGATAFADGCRMTLAIKIADDESQWPLGLRAGLDDEVLLLKPGKMSYAPKRALEPIWLTRIGWLFEPFRELRLTPEQAERARADQVLRFLSSELKRDPPRYHNERNLKNDCLAMLKMKQRDVQTAIADLISAGRLRSVSLPKEQAWGARKTYLAPGDH